MSILIKLNVKCHVCVLLSIIASFKGYLSVKLMLCPILLLFEFVCFQIQVSYYPPGQYPSSGQQYRVPQSMSHQVSYPAQRTQPIPQPTQQSGQYRVLSNLFFC